MKNLLQAGFHYKITINYEYMAVINVPWGNINFKKHVFNTIDVAQNYHNNNNYYTL